MNIAEARVNAQIDLARKRRELEADRNKNAERKDPAAELLEMRRRLHGE